MIDMTIHSTGTGTCSLSGKEGPGLTVTFKDGTVSNAFLSWKAFQQLVGMKTGQQKKPEARAAQPAQAVPVAGNGPPKA